jgi:hypothetical protein
MRELTNRLTFGWKMSQNKYPLTPAPYYSTQSSMAIPRGIPANGTGFLWLCGSKILSYISLHYRNIHRYFSLVSELAQRVILRVTAPFKGLPVHHAHPSSQISSHRRARHGHRGFMQFARKRFTRIAM